MRPTPAGRSSQEGSVLVAIIIGMTVVATLGTAMTLFYTASTTTQTGATDFNRAYYLAEGGGRYAIDKIIAFEDTGPGSAARTTFIATLDNQTFTLSDNATFHLDLTYNGGVYTLKSTGAPATSNASRTITYRIYYPPGGAGGVDIPFTGGPGNVLDPNDWNTTGTPKVPGGSGKVQMTGTGDTGSLDWNNGSSSLPSLLTIWQNSDKLLTYEVQVKIDMPPGKERLAGICFRLDTKADKTTWTDDEFYGLSLLYYDSGTTLPAFVDRLGAGYTFTAANNILLWKQVAGVRTVLERIDAPAALLSGGKFEKEITLFVRVHEQYQSPGVRENLITAYWAEKADYPAGTIDWDYTNGTKNQILWTGCDPAFDCSAAKDCSCIVDTSLTSANFDSRLPDEIGIHALGGSGSDKVEMTDLAVRFNFSGGGTIQY